MHRLLRYCEEDQERIGSVKVEGEVENETTSRSPVSAAATNTLSQSTYALETEMAGIGTAQHETVSSYGEYLSYSCLVPFRPFHFSQISQW